MNKSELISALAARTDLEAEVGKLERLSTDTTACLKEIETTCTLDDGKALAEITRLQVVSNLLPRRISAREEALVKADETLMQYAGALVADVLGKRNRALLARARAQARTALEKHFKAGPQLDDAVERSAIVAELSASSPTIEANPGDGAVGYARRLLALSDALDAIEAKLG